MKKYTLAKIIDSTTMNYRIHWAFRKSSNCSRFSNP